MSQLISKISFLIIVTLLSHLTKDISCANQVLEQPKRNDTAEVKRAYMLKLINNERDILNRNLTQLYIDDQLTQIAQTHSIDMIKRKFFDHINPDGEDPEARAQKAGFYYLVGQNMAMAKNFTRAHQLIKNSQKHYNNTIDPQWTRCGIGFTYNQSNTLYVTILFSIRDLSKYPVYQYELAIVQKQLVKYILNVNTQLISQNWRVSVIIRSWFNTGYSDKMSIIEYMKQKKYFQKGIKYLNSGTKIAWSDNLIKKIRQADLFVQKDLSVRRFGVHLKMNDINVQIMIVYQSN